MKTIKNGPSQSQRDRVLWILANSGGKMEHSTLMRRADMRLADLEPILGEPAREGRIRITDKVISLI
jgi:hypothetical protein